MKITKQQKNLSIQVLFIASKEVWILSFPEFITTTSLSIELSRVLLFFDWLFIGVLVFSFGLSEDGLLFFFSLFGGGALISIFWLRYYFLFFYQNGSYACMQ